MLLIDEPTSGLDPAGQREMLDLLAEVRGRNHTIFLTTHFLDEIELLCDTVGILFAGKLAAEIDVQSLRVPGRNVLIRVAHTSPELIERLRRISPAVRYTGREIMLQPSSAALQAQVLRALLDADVPIIALEPQGRPLEDIYMRIVRGEPAELPGAEPPHGIFAPPGHPDATTRVLESADSTPPGRPGTGDTLLRELLKQDREPKNDSPESKT
jgi:ABC-2 type transport system ATP-binding protein